MSKLFLARLDLDLNVRRRSISHFCKIDRFRFFSHYYCALGARVCNVDLVLPLPLLGLMMNSSVQQTRFSSNSKSPNPQEETSFSSDQEITVTQSRSHHKEEQNCHNQSTNNSKNRQLTFVSRTNPATGKMDWVIQDENYDYIQEIARSGYGDMLHDTDRNEKYYKAISQAIKLLKKQGKKVKTLDIGTGTGLLSMMAAHQGADVIHACEAFEPMAQCAEKVLEANGMKNKIKLIHKRSTEVSLDDIEERANLLVTELFDTELIGEGAIESYTDAHLRLMDDNAVAVPTTGIMYVQAVQCPLLQNWNSVQTVHLPNGMSVSAPPSMHSCSGAPSLHDLQVDELHEHLTFVSEPVEVFRFDFSRRNALQKNESNVQTVLALQDGSVDAFVMWWDLIMDPQGEITLSCGPCWTRTEGEDIPWRDHWMQALYYPSSPLAVKAGEVFKIYSNHDEYSLWFDTQETSNQRPVCECGLHVAMSRSRLGQLNDPRRNQIYIQSLQKHVTKDTVCLVVSDGSLLPLFAAQLGAKKVFYLDTNWACQKVMRNIVEHNKLQDRIVMLEKSAEDITEADLHNLKIDVVMADPFFQAAHLPWEHLYFWYALTSIQPHLSRDVIILPGSLTVWAMAVQFKDLYKIRAPVGMCEGFDITEFDRLIESSCASVDSEIEAQPLWEYPSKALSEPTSIFTLDFSKPPSEVKDLDCSSELVCFRDGLMNGVVFWIDYKFGDGRFVTMGPLDGDWKGAKIRWDKFSRQGVQLLRRGHQVAPDTVVKVSTEFEPESGEFSIFVNCGI